MIINNYKVIFCFTCRALIGDLRHCVVELNEKKTELMKDEWAKVQTSITEEFAK